MIFDPFHSYWYWIVTLIAIIQKKRSCSPVLVKFCKLYLTKVCQKFTYTSLPWMHIQNFVARTSDPTSFYLLYPNSFICHHSLKLLFVYTLDNISCGNHINFRPELYFTQRYSGFHLYEFWHIFNNLKGTINSWRSTVLS